MGDCHPVLRNNKPFYDNANSQASQVTLNQQNE